MFHSVKSTLTTLGALALGCVLAGVAVKPANAGNTSCTGSKYFVTCTSYGYDYQSGTSYSCYGSGTPGYVTWSCTSY